MPSKVPQACWTNTVPALESKVQEQVQVSQSVDTMLLRSIRRRSSCLPPASTSADHVFVDVYVCLHDGLELGVRVQLDNPIRLL